MTISSKIKEYTELLKQGNLLRNRIITHSVSNLVHFDRNDYLSLAMDARLSAAYQQGFSLFPAGSGGSMLLSGYHPIHQQVEQAFAELLEVDACILFSSGYAANLAVTGLLGSSNTHCLIDKEVHASIYDGLALAKVSFSRYINDNLEQLKRHPEAAVITEGIFSMSGKTPNLTTMAQQCRRSQAVLIADEAHSFGVLGLLGKGSVHAHSLQQNEVPLRIIPLGKAYAAQGALVAGQGDWIDALLQAGRPLIYSTAMSPAYAYGLLKTIEVVTGADERRYKLRELITVFRECIQTSPLKWSNSPTQIQQLQLANPHLALHFSDELRKYGFSCSAIRTPTVTMKNTGLRIVLNYAHETEQIGELFKRLHFIYEHTYS